MRSKEYIFLFFFLIQLQISRAQDWPALSRYRDSNEILKQKTNPGNRVVFLGNSITDFWINESPDFFSANHFIDRGISGQTSPQMLVRFRADVIHLKPALVLLECGTNDIAGNTGPSTLGMIEDNIMSMSELAQANNIQIILCSVLPASKFLWKPDVQPADSIIDLNIWIKAYARSRHFAYLDYYSNLVDENKGMKAEYSEDGVHPNHAGYKVMESVALPVIFKTLKKIDHSSPFPNS